MGFETSSFSPDDPSPEEINHWMHVLRWFHCRSPHLLLVFVDRARHGQEHRAAGQPPEDSNREGVLPPSAHHEEADQRRPQPPAEVVEEVEKGSRSLRCAGDGGGGEGGWVAGRCGAVAMWAALNHQSAGTILRRWRHWMHSLWRQREMRHPPNL